MHQLMFARVNCERIHEFASLMFYVYRPATDQSMRLMMQARSVCNGGVISGYSRL
jgi:hypothetical protein